MSLYLDSSALVKRYAAEPGSDIVAKAVSADPLLCTSIVSRAEISAALAAAARHDVLDEDEAREARDLFRGEWTRLARVHLTEAVVGRADEAAWTHALRGYDAVQLACAQWWRESVDPGVVFATFDRHLWGAAEGSGFAVLPEDLPALLDRWRLEARSDG